MTYQHQKLSKPEKKKLGEDMIEVEFILEDVDLEKSVESPKSEHKYELSPKYTLREKGADRKMRKMRKNIIKVERPVSSAEYRVETYRVYY
jgi:hypothetical protein